MKLLIVGGNGMAGHMLVDYFKRCAPYTVFYTTRERKQNDGLYLDVRDTLLVDKLIESVAPDVVINCVGILNKHADLKVLEAYWVNSFFPHYLKDAVEKVNGKVIHISTDCVFTGDRGNYSEKDVPDGTSLYAKTKALGEVTNRSHLTIRTSIVGPEIRKHGIGLFQWFMQQQGTVYGYKNVIWNGVTTLELAKAIHYMIDHKTEGLIHLHAPQKISKYDLLKLFQREFNHDRVQIVPDGSLHQDRTLVSTRTDFQYNTGNYEQMLRELREWMCLR